MEVTQEKWTEITVTVDTKDIETAGNIANMVVPYGIYIEDYSALEEETMEIAHIDLIEASLLQKDRTKGIIHIYISPEENPAEAVSFLEERLQSAGIAYTLGTDLCAMEDWVNNWKKYFHPMPVGDKLLIRPTWEDADPTDGRKVLHIEPGLAFGTAGCAAVHATSYPLGGKYHVAHGESNYAMFTGVLKNYMELRRDGEIAVLNQYLADLLGCMTNVVYDELEKLLDQILPKRPLREYGVTREDLPVFAHSVVTEQGRLMANNFVPLDEARVLKIYQELF